MKSLIIILIGLYGSWHYTDISSESGFNSMFAPCMLFIFLISLAIWLVLKAGFGGRSSDNGSFGGSDGFGDGGDSG